MNLTQFHAYRLSRSSLKAEGRLAPYHPTRWWLKLLARLLGRWKVYLGVEYNVVHYERTPVGGLPIDITTATIDVWPLLDLVREQIYHYQREGHKPTKIIVGPETLRSFARFTEETPSFFSWTVPDGVPLLMGLEVVVNPCIEGVAVG